MKNVLDKKFIHYVWFKNSNLTRKQAIEYFASNVGDFYLKKKSSKIQSDNIFNDINYDIVLYGSEDGRNYKMTNEEVDYYNIRKEFWTEFYKEHDFTERKTVPEYNDYIKALNIP